MRRRNGGIPGTGCKLDTDGDGNCPIHPYGCLMAKIEQEQLDRGDPCGAGRSQRHP